MSNSKITIQTDMNVKKIGSIVISMLEKQGVSFLLLGLAVWYFHTQNIKLTQEMNLCNQNIITVYQEQNSELMKVLNRNSEAIEKIINQNQ